MHVTLSSLQRVMLFSCTAIAPVIPAITGKKAIATSGERLANHSPHLHFNKCEAMGCG